MYPTQSRPHHGSVVKQFIHSLQKVQPASNQIVLHLYYDLTNDTSINEGITIIRKKIPSYSKILQWIDTSYFDNIIADNHIDFIHFHNFFPSVILFSDKILSSVPYILQLRGSCVNAIKNFHRKSKLNKFITRAKGFVYTNYYYMHLLDVHTKEAIPPGKMYCLPNYKTDDWLIDKNLKSFNKSDVKIIVIAAFEERKNLINNLTALQKVSQTHPIRVDIYGSIHHQNYYDKVKLLFNDKIQYKGIVNNHSLKQVIDNADMLIVLVLDIFYDISDSACQGSACGALVVWYIYFFSKKGRSILRSAETTSGLQSAILTALGQVARIAT
jgi:hypothetical protein